MKKKRLIILLSFLIPIFILTGLALWIVTTDHVITPAYDENHTLAQYFVEETNTSYDGNEKTPNFKDGVYTNDEDKENFLNTVDFYYKAKGTIGAYTEGLPTNAGTYSVEFALNDVVIKCVAGMASSVCVALDSMYSDMMLGTIAGDDTIFIVTRGEAQALQLSNELKRIM